MKILVILFLSPHVQYLTFIEPHDLDSCPVWYLERNKLISPMQCGFRKQRSTTAHLVRLESFVREAFAQPQHAVGVFFDREKAYKSTWKLGIMRDLHNAGLRGRLPPSPLHRKLSKKRQFNVRLGSSYSDLFDHEMGVPQGSIISVTLYGLKINSIVKAISPGVECSICRRFSDLLKI